MKRDIISIARNFKLNGEIDGFNSDTTGHINDSYHIRIKGEHPGYFLQWVNSYIFKDVPGLMKNIEIVTSHLANRLKSATRKDDTIVLELVTTLEGHPYFQDKDGEFWRMYKFIPGIHVYDVVENSTIAYQGGKAFGRFISDLSDLPAHKLIETIPDFHNLEVRMFNFQTSLEADKAGRKKEISDEINFVMERTGEMLKIPFLLKQGHLPIRITHNDTKFNNILFNEDNKAICIVDLDTVMPGCVLYDFGDAIRTGANTACEDQKELSKVDINLDIYRSYTRGFVHETKNSLTHEEISNLAFSARFMTYIIGLRFLTDFLDGDPYFRTNYTDHNLVRARVQFKLLEMMEINAQAMNEIVLRACENCKSDF